MSNSIDTSALLGQMREMARAAGIPTSGPSASGLRVPDGRASGSPFAGGLDALADVARRDGMRPLDLGERRGDGVVFTDLFRRSVEGVNARARESRGLVEAFEVGAPGVELADVMIAVQKARISFETLSQVRNKMLAAYKDIMSTPL